MVEILIAEDDDIPQILEIESEAISPPWTHGALLDELCIEDSLFAVARGVAAIPQSVADNGKWRVEEREYGDIQGFLILRCMGDDGELLQVAVDKALRRTGIADALMETAIGFAEGNKLKSVYLEVRESNEAAIMLYQKHGFKPISFRREYFSDPIEDAIVMSCELSQDLSRSSLE